MPNHLTQEEIKLLEDLVKVLSPATDTSEGAEFIEVECNKCGDGAVYVRLAEQLKKMGIKPTPERLNGLFTRLAHKGNK